LDTRFSFSKLLCINLLFIQLVSGQSLKLTNTNQYVNVGDLDISGNQLTVEAKIFMSSTSLYAMNIVSKHTDSSNLNYLLRPKTFEISTSNGFYLMNNPYALELNKWYHVAGTYDGQFVRYYVNGCLVIKNPATGNLLQNNINTGIGNRTQNFQEFEQFFGSIDEVRIWNVCRSENDIKNNMNTLPNPSTQVGLKGYYKFNSNLLNEIANINHGAAVGSIQYDNEATSINPFQYSGYKIVSTSCSKYTIELLTNVTNAQYSLNGTNYSTSNSLSINPGNQNIWIRSPEGCVIQTVLNLPPITLSTPTFNQIAPICSGSTISLPLTSNNGITGTWSPVLNNTATTMYTFTPTVGACSTTATMTIEVLQCSEICADGLDNDNDGFVDGFDSDCPCVDNTYFNICQPECQIDFTPEPLSIIQNWSTNTPIITMSSIVSGDINNDGMTEIVALGTTGMTVNNPRITSGINIFNGSNGSLISTFPTPYIYWEAPGSILIADVNNDGLGEIIFASSTSGNNAINQRYLFCYDINGNLIWKSNVQYGANTPGNNKGGGTLGIADFNLDGIPEVYIFNEIFNAQTGIKLIDGGSNGIGRMETSLNNLLNGVYSLTVAADLTNNFGLELAAGKTVYNIIITNTNGTFGNTMSPINNPLNKDGFTSIADINLDGLLDVVVSTSGNSSSSLLYIWNPITNNIISSINIPTGTNLDLVGVPFIGDMDGDGAPEIGVCRPYKLLTYKFINNNLVLKWELITTDNSGATKISMFDFNQDGIQEIIYRDETQLRVINGSGTTPIVLSNFSSLSGTAFEGPVICDINNDNQSNIIITSDDPTLGPFKGRIQSFKSNGQPWAPSRKIWNQYAYFNVNINDDLTIPIQQQNHGLQFYNSLGSCLGATLRPLNSFMAQETIRDISGCPIYPAPDLIISQVDNIVYDCNNQISSFDLTIENQGSKTVLTEFNILIFEGNNTNPGSLIKSEMVNFSIAPSTQATVTIELSNLSLTDVFAIINFNNSNQVFPYNSVNECDYSNNFFNFSLMSQPITPTFTQAPTICYGNPLVDLPNLSTNGITGTWSPALNNTATTTYTFTPNSGQCATTTTMTINVISNISPPTGNPIQVFCATPTPLISDLTATGTAIQWYASATGSTTLNNNNALINGTIYFGTQTIDGCESTNRFQTTVSIVKVPTPFGDSFQKFCLEKNPTVGNLIALGTNVSWYDSINNGIKINNNTLLQDKTKYYATSKDAQSGCESRERLSVTANLILCDVVIFNSIKVDAEPMSDRLYIDDISYFPNNSIQIFNRYGRLVWETKGYNNDTNAFKGKANVPDLFQKDEQLPAGTYFYILNYFNFIDQIQREKNGYLELFNSY